MIDVDMQPDDDTIDSHRVEHDWNGETALSQTIVSAVAAFTNTATGSLPPLYGAVDPDAINQLFAPSRKGHHSRNHGRFVFEYAGCEITACADGNVVINARD